MGAEQVNAVIDRAKQQEQIEAEQKRAVRRNTVRSSVIERGLIKALLIVMK